VEYAWLGCSWQLQLQLMELFEQSEFFHPVVIAATANQTDGT
jgi:hypothetical protein